MTSNPDRPQRIELPLLSPGRRNHKSCRWGCGDACSQEPPNRSGNETYTAVVERALSRRSFLAAGGMGALVLSAAAAPADASEVPPVGPYAPHPTGRALAFTPIAPNRADAITLAEGYANRVLIAWGDPVRPGAPGFDFDGQSAAAQAKQFGYNNDYLAFFPLPFWSANSHIGVLWSNHEYTNPELMFRNYDATSPTREQVDIQLEAHGGSIVLIERAKRGGPFRYRQLSRYNRRITATTPMRLTGPAAGDALLKTSADASGRRVSGMLNNCAGGVTPWGTVLTGEENFHQYFANLAGVTDARVKALHERYLLPTGASERKWEAHHDRFDLTKEPNEPFRFGWVVEIDPYDPDFTPRKHTALGRVKHEGATTTLTRSKRVAVYTGDDERFEYFFKFVSRNKYRRDDRRHNLGLLDEGTLYVAKLADDGTGRWLPLRHGEGPLTAANGFASQAEVLINARGAGDLLGATKMDRPEDIQRNPVTGRVYVNLTNNTNRTATGTDAANPRGPNPFGHVLELREDGDDAAATSFRWRIFLLCGDPNDPGTYFAGYDKTKVSPIGSPDNMTFDNEGNLWLATDGSQPVGSSNNGLLACPTTGSERGHVQLFATVPVGAETCGPLFTRDNRSLFIAVQHPGEGGTVEAPTSHWPDGGTSLPRPAVTSIWRSADGDPVIGR
jgi:secreted PhoX family phosphatase